MHIIPRLLRASLPLLATFAMSACGGGLDDLRDDVNALTLKARIAAVETEIKLLPALETICTRSADCEALPMGARACGGPSSHLIASSANPSYGIAKKSAEIHASLSRKLLELEGSVGTCEVLLTPSLTCSGLVLGKCEPR